MSLASTKVTKGGGMDADEDEDRDDDSDNERGKSLALHVLFFVLH